MPSAFARLLPPLLADAGRAVRDRMRGRKTVPVWEHLPQGWDTEPAPRGWDVRGVAAAQEADWPRFLDLVRGTAPLGIAHERAAPAREDVVAHNTVMAFGYVLALAARERDRVALLDWGGGLGHYYVLARALLPGVDLDYTVYDLPLACEAGRRLLPGARFVELPAEPPPDGYDLVLASGSLQYARDWRPVLAGLARATRKYVYLTRLPLVEQVASFVVVQRPPRYGTEYRGWCLNRRDLLEAATGAGLQLQRETLAGEPIAIAGAPERVVPRGFLFTRP